MFHRPPSPPLPFPFLLLPLLLVGIGGCAAGPADPAPDAAAPDPRLQQLRDEFEHLADRHSAARRAVLQQGLAVTLAEERVHAAEREVRAAQAGWDAAPPDPVAALRRFDEAVQKRVRESPEYARIAEDLSDHAVTAWRVEWSAHWSISTRLQLQPSLHVAPLLIRHMSLLYPGYDGVVLLMELQEQQPVRALTELVALVREAERDAGSAAEQDARWEMAFEQARASLPLITERRPEALYHFQRMIDAAEEARDIWVTVAARRRNDPNRAKLLANIETVTPLRNAAADRLARTKEALQEARAEQAAASQALAAARTEAAQLRLAASRLRGELLAAERVASGQTPYGAYLASGRR